MAIQMIFNIDSYIQRCYTCSHNTLLDGEDDFNCLADDHEHHQDEGRAQRFDQNQGPSAVVLSNCSVRVVSGTSGAAD